MERMRNGGRTPTGISKRPKSSGGFLTTDANADVAAYHSKAMPVILTSQAEWDLWLSGAHWPDVRELQRPLPDGSLQIVARGSRLDEALLG